MLFCLELDSSQDMCDDSRHGHLCVHCHFLKMTRQEVCTTQSCVNHECIIQNNIHANIKTNNSRFGFDAYRYFADTVL